MFYTMPENSSDFEYEIIKLKALLHEFSNNMCEMIIACFSLAKIL